MNKQKRKWLIFYFVLLGLMFGSLWLTDLTAEQLLFNLHVSMKGANGGAVWRCIFFSCVSSAVTLFVILQIFRKINMHDSKHRLFQIAWKVENHRWIVVVISIFVCLLYMNYHLEFIEFIKNQTVVTTIYQEKYIDPKNVTYTFPEKKRNLIYIYLESMEVTYTSEEEGGIQSTDLIPELRHLAQKYINFSPNDGFGGSYTVPGTTWTMAAMVAQSSGLPVKLPFDGEKYYGNYSRMLPGAWTLGDILQEEGYNQVLLMGSDSSFAGRADYFLQHGDYKIDDYNTALEDGRLPKNYHEWWGYEDQKLFAYAKEELLRLAEEGKPFNLTMLTADTHFEEGYKCSLCQDDNLMQYANVIQCSSHQVSTFIEWIQQQDFYEDTTIVISGDHLSMDSTFFRLIDDTYDRQVYNCIINPAVENAKQYEKNRIFTTMDLFPTTLASLGVVFDSDRLGLGTNLFSGLPTLAEEYGIEELRKQLSYHSNYYNYHIIYTN